MGIFLHGHAIHSNCRSLHSCPKSRYSSILLLSCSSFNSALFILKRTSLEIVPYRCLLSLGHRFLRRHLVRKPLFCLPANILRFLRFSRFAHVSILFSLIRLDPSENRRRRLRYIASSSAPFSFLSFFGSANQNQCGKTDLAHNATSASKSQYAN